MQANQKPPTTHLNPSSLACLQQPTILLHPRIGGPLEAFKSWNVTSSDSHRWDRIAYKGILLPKNSSRTRFSVCSSRILILWRAEAQSLLASGHSGAILRLRNVKYGLLRERYIRSAWRDVSNAQASTENRQKTFLSWSLGNPTVCATPHFLWRFQIHKEAMKTQL